MTGDDPPNVLVMGETLVDFLPDRPGPLGDVESFERRAGGAPANVAVALTRLDVPPWFRTNVSTDPFGDHLAATLDDYGVPDRFVTRDDNHKTALAFVTHDETADRSFSFYRENTADLHTDAATIPDSALGTVDFVVVSGVMLTAEPARSETFHLAERARGRDCQVVFDPNGRSELWPDPTEEDAVVERMLGLTDVVKTAADDFARSDYPSGPAALADALHRAGPHTVLLTRGGDGSAVSTTDDAPWDHESGVVDHPGYDVDAVDTTGAGDAFLGGALAALTRDDALEDVLAFANAVAALATTSPGAMAALPTRADVRDFHSQVD